MMNEKRMQPPHVIDECETPDKLTYGRPETRKRLTFSLLPEKSADRFSVVDAADRLGEHRSNF